ncbi:MAG TPA: hypothetical protein VJ508_10030, partial [Saprospiraceae bacterium]|nr:hypothetical protein [Saprospiraceae bacterium]
MKKVVLTCLLLLGVFSMTQVLAVRSSSGFKVMPAPAMQLQSQMTVNDFLAFDVKNYRTSEGRKMGFFKRTAIHLVQKKLAKKVSKGKIEGTMPFKEAVAGHSSNKFGLLSVIFGAVGLFIPYVGLPLLIAGLVLGIMGIKRDANPTLAIIGTAINGAF